MLSFLQIQSKWERVAQLHQPARSASDLRRRWRAVRCRYADSGWLVALGIGVCVFHLPQLVAGTVQFDGLDVHYSSQRYLSDAIRAGHLPFWTPYLFSGFPFLADLQVGAWYPLNWPFFLAGITPRSIGGELLLHSLIACGGAYALGLRLIGRPAPAVACGIFYGLSGWFAAHSQHVGMFEAAAWLPWLMLALEHVAERISPRRLVFTGLLGAAVALPGHFQVALYAFCGVGIWALLEAAVRRSLTRARRVAIGFAIAVGLGALLSAVMILPALELVAHSVRKRLNALDVVVVDNLGYFHPSSLLTLVQPDHYGLLSGRYTGPGDSTQHYFYAGMFLVPLALLGLRHQRVVRTALFLGLPFAWYALGPPGGLFSVVARLPGFGSVELPMHGWFLPALGLALLGGAGLAVVERRMSLSRPWAAVLLVVLLADVFTVNELLNPLAFARGTFDELYGNRLRSFQSQLEAAELPVQRLYGPPLATIGYRNHPLQSRVATTYGYNPLELEHYADYAEAAESNPRLTDGMAASHYLRTDLTIEPIPSTLPLVFLARRIVSVDDEAGARDSLAQLDPAQTTVVIGPPPPVELDPSAAASVDVVEKGEDYLIVHYRTGSPGVLRVAIPSYPGWRATLGGRDLPTLTVDHAFLGVLVPAGEADIHLAYTSTFFWLGAAISALSLVVCLIALTVGWRVR